ncbi:MAG: hypothetical protein PF450_11800, partial [Bacteroidales bacterium]|nr:hypothetical protein [Bacteroidales bacterium]
PNSTVLPYVVGEGMEYINANRLYFILGYSSMATYKLDSMELFRIRRSTFYNYIKAFKTYRKHEIHFILANLGLADNRKALAEKGLYTKLLLLDKAFSLKCSDSVSREKVFEYLLNLSFPEFLYYIYPQKKQEVIWKNKLEVWNRQIRSEFKRTGKVMTINYVPAPGVRERIRDVILKVSKEVN